MSADGISADGIFASYGEGGRYRHRRLALVVTTRLNSAEVKV